MKDEQKLSFWKKIKISITDFEKYQELAAEKIGKTFLYLVLLMLIFNIVVAGIYTYKFTATINEVKTYIADNIETITFEENKLHILPKNGEDIIRIENEALNTKVLINTQTSKEEDIKQYVDEIKSSENGILILTDKIMIKNELLMAPYSYSYANIAEQYNINHLDKQELINLLSGNSFTSILIYFFGIMFIYMFTMYFSSTLVDIFVLSILAYIVSVMSKMKLKFSAVYNIAAYSITLPLILNMIYFAVNAFTGFTIKYFEVMYTGVASIYIITAILMIKSDVIKKQIELTKIIEEQEKVRLEIQRQEEEKRQQEEQERKRKEEEKKRKEEEKEEPDKKPTKKKDKEKNEQPNLDMGNQPSTAKETEL